MLNEKVQDVITMKGRVRACLWDKDGNLKQEQVVDNLVVTAGKAGIASNLTAGSPTPASMRVNKIALGTGTNSPAAGDTTLQTETYRKNTASAASASNVATITGYFTATETSGTFREAGLFMSGTASADTGTLLSRVAINITKTTSDTLTIEWTITIS